MTDPTLIPPPTHAVYENLPERVRETLNRSWTDRLSGTPGTSALDQIDPAYWRKKGVPDCIHAPLANAYWGVIGSNAHDAPNSIWNALNRIDSASLNILVAIFERLEAIDAQLWDNIRWVRNIWVGTSAGFKCEYFDRRKATNLYGNVHTLCRDSATGASDHPGCDCWREVPNGDVPWALHCLVGDFPLRGGTTPVAQAKANRALDEVHLDWHSPVDEREEDGMCDYALLKIPLHCIQVFAGVGVEPSPFLMDHELIAAREQIEFLATFDQSAANSLRNSADALQVKLAAMPLRRLACQGASGWHEARNLAVEIRALGSNAKQFLQRSSASPYFPWGQ